MAAYIADNTMHEVFYVNHSHIEDYERHKGSRLQYLSVEETDFSEFDGSIFIAPINYFLVLLAKIRNHKNSKICLYVYDKRSVGWMFSHFGKEAKLAELRELLYKSDACSFADIRCYEKLSGFKGIFFPQMTDLPITDIKPAPLTDTEEINIGYYGTLTKERACCVQNVIDNLKVSNLNKKVNFHIIGSSAHFYKIDISDAHNAGCRFVCTGRLTDEQSCEYIRKNVDLVLASDENAVKAAMFGVPVAIPVTEGKPYDGDDYVLIKDARGYILSWNSRDLVLLKNESRSLKSLLEDIYDGRKERIAAECRDFVVKNFSCETLMPKFLKYTRDAKLTPSECMETDTVKKAVEDFDKFVRAYGKKDFKAYLYFTKTGKYRPKKEKKTLSGAIVKGYGKFVNAVNERKTVRGYMRVQKSYREKAERIAENHRRTGQKIKVAFAVVFDSVFPTRTIFEKLLNDDVFDPYILMLPNVSNSYKYQINLYESGLKSLSEQYPGRVIGAYDAEKDEYAEFGDEYPVMFFCNPYKHLVHPYHHVEYFLDKDVLPIYSSYGFAALKFWDEVIATPFYNYMWKCTLETESNLEHLKKTEKIRGKNGVVTGYLKMDKLAELKPVPHTRKRIMICPHHTVWGWKNLNIGNFLSYAEYFQRLPEMFPEADFIFRPHPLLLANLKLHKVWTQAQIDEYMARLLAHPNMVYDTSGDYMQVFADSDAMIHDCGSFIGEYLYTMKPCCYMLKSEDAVKTTLVPLGQKCMEQYYHAFCEDDITRFIKEVVIDGNDPMKEQRERFAKNELMVNFPHAADAVIGLLKKELKII